MQKRVRSKHTAEGSPPGNPRPPEEVGEGLEAQHHPALATISLPPRKHFWGGATDGVTGMFAGGTRACGCREGAFLPCGNSRCRGIFIQE